jgi:hypothetical protein
MTPAVQLAAILSDEDLAEFIRINSEVEILIAARKQFRRGRARLEGFREANQKALAVSRGPGAAAVIKNLPALSREFAGQPGWESELRQLEFLHRRLENPKRWICNPVSPAELIMNLARL